jgi:hypothetical protein
MAREAPRGALGDGLLIGAVVLASAGFYVGYLGFYSDDLAFLEGMVLGGADRSFPALLQNALWANSIWTRPVQALYATGLYQVFGLDPLGYHLVNTAVIAAGVTFFYLALREFGSARPVAFAVALLYGLLPHYSTDRYFYMVFQAPLSMTTYFLSLYAELRSVTARPGRAWWSWRALATGAMLVSVLSYEVFLPLFFLHPLLAWQRRRELTGRSRVSRGEVLQVAVLPALLIVGASVFKAATSDRLQEGSLGEHLGWFAKFLAKGAWTALAGDFGLRLPAVMADVVVNHEVGAVLAAGIAVALLVFAWLWRMGDDAALADAATVRRLLAAAAVFFVGGYSIFLFSFMAAITSTGMDNRTAIAASVGVAFGAVALLVWLCTLLRAPRTRAGLFAALLALACGSGFVLVNVLGLYWAAAAKEQGRVLAALRRDLPTLAPGTTLVLDGVCRYVGPGSVFETWWDTTGAVRVLYRDKSLQADVVTPRTLVTEQGPVSRIYNMTSGPYAFAGLLVYNVPEGRTYRLPDAESAREYFRTRNPMFDGGCRPDLAGAGERVFVPGARVATFPP